MMNNKLLQKSLVGPVFFISISSFLLFNVFVMQGCKSNQSDDSAVPISNVSKQVDSEMTGDDKEKKEKKLTPPKGYRVGPVLPDGKYHCCVTGGGHEWKSKDNVHKDYDCFREIVSLGSGCPG